MMGTTRKKVSIWLSKEEEVELRAWKRGDWQGIPMSEVVNILLKVHKAAQEAK